MDAYKETYETWNKVASLYQEKFMDMNYYDESYDFICQSIQQNNPKILEIGCGPGNITRYLLSKRPDFQINGIDFSPKMIEFAQKNNPQSKFEVMDAREIKQFNTQFEAIICGFIIPYLTPKDHQKFLLDCFDLLSPNGILYLSFVEGNTSQSGFKTTKDGDRVFFHYYDLKTLLKQLTDLQFKQLETFLIQYPQGDNQWEEHRILILKKNSTKA